MTPYLASSRAVWRSAARSLASCGGPFTAQNRTGWPLALWTNWPSFDGDEPVFAGELFVQETQVDRAVGERIGSRIEGEPATASRPAPCLVTPFGSDHGGGRASRWVEDQRAGQCEPTALEPQSHQGGQ